MDSSIQDCAGFKGDTYYVDKTSVLRTSMGFPERNKGRKSMSKSSFGASFTSFQFRADSLGDKEDFYFNHLPNQTLQKEPMFISNEI